MTAWRPRARASDTASTNGRPSLEAILEHYGVQLRGRNKQMVKCPLHEERTPSCSIWLDEGLWNCHSCGQGGTSWDLLMKKEGVTFEQARAVAARLGLTADGAGRGGQPVSGGSYFKRRSVPPASGNKPGNGGYQPSWRRR